MTRVLLLAGVIAGGCILAAAQTPAPTPATPELAAAQAASRAYAVTYYAGQSWLGVGLADVDPFSQQRLHLASPSGAEVVEVYANSPAAAAGVKAHDVITSFDGQAVRSVRQLDRLVNETPADRTVALRLLRDGKPVEAQVHLEGRPGPRLVTGAWSAMPRFNYAPRVAPMPPMPPMPRMAPMAPMAPMTPMMPWASTAPLAPGAPLAPEAPMTPLEPMAPLRPTLATPGRFGMYSDARGLGLETLSPQLAEFFGLPSGETGLLVRSVEGDSAAAKAGFAAGDVVTQVGSDKVGDIGQFEAALREHRGETVSATVWRKHAKVTLHWTLPSSR